MNTTELVRKLEDLLDGIERMRVEVAPKQQRAFELFKELYSLSQWTPTEEEMRSRAAQYAGAPKPKDSCRFYDQPKWMTDGVFEMRKAFEAWLAAHVPESGAKEE